MDKPQIICHAQKSLGYTVFDGRWIPCSAKFVSVGSQPRGTGIIQTYEISGGDVALLQENVKEQEFKCCTFGASSLRERRLATGSFEGCLEIWDVENFDKEPVFVGAEHEGIINCVDGVAGGSVGRGAPELATAGRDGKALVWDPRQQRPTASILPAPDGPSRDCWAIAFGNSYNNTERMLCTGYDNGDVKLFDLRTTKIRWETNIKNGVCCLQFDRQEIEMNKLVATTLEAKFHLWDMRTQHRTKGFASLSEKAHKSTIWTCRHLPQNRDLFVTTGGNGSVCLWKYCYPNKRVKEDLDKEKVGVVGKVELLQSSILGTQPLGAFDWSPDKAGLALTTSFDQSLRVLIFTKTNLY